MKRFLIFTALFPVLVLLVFIASDQDGRRNYPDMEALLWMLWVDFAFAIVPAWVSAGADWALSAKPIYLRLVGTAATGALAIMAALVSLRFGDVVSRSPLLVMMIGAIPAAVCSLLSSAIQNRRVG